jgi:hypothetical protein
MDESDPKVFTVLDDRILDEVLYSPVCSYCKHWSGDPDPERWRTCRAFPKRIPDAIWEGRNDHTRPYPGDQGFGLKEENKQKSWPIHGVGQKREA